MIEFLRAVGKNLSIKCDGMCQLWIFNFQLHSSGSFRERDNLPIAHTSNWSPKTIAAQRERTTEVFRHQQIHSFQRTNSCKICEFVTHASQMNTSHTMHSTIRRCVDEGSCTSQMALVSWPNQCFRCFYWHCACKIAQFYSGLQSFRLWTRATLVWIQIERAAAKSNIQLCRICFKPPIGIWKTRACGNLYFIVWYRFQSH